jgi:hypothetical protein
MDLNGLLSTIVTAHPQLGVQGRKIRPPWRCTELNQGDRKETAIDTSQIDRNSCANRTKQRVRTRGALTLNFPLQNGAT